MSNISNAKLQEVIDFYTLNGEKQTLLKLNISDTTLHRYIREYRLRNRNVGSQQKRNANILVFDIETAPLEAYVWRMWKENVGLEQLESDWFCLTWSAKWLMEPEVFSRRLTVEEVKNGDDERIMADLWEFINAADIIIAHNGNAFDLPKINSRFLIHGMQPPLPYQSIDTMLVARKKFGFSSNKLQFISTTLGLDGKIKTDFGNWLRIISEKYPDSTREEAILEMETYNKRDVTLLEEVYLRLRPWIPSHPNMGLFTDSNEGCCHACGSKEIIWTEGYYTTMVGKYPVYRCQHCGATGRSRVSALSKVKRENLVTSLAR